jgi:hypothetical protein
MLASFYRILSYWILRPLTGHFVARMLQNRLKQRQISGLTGIIFTLIKRFNILFSVKIIQKLIYQNSKKMGKLLCFPILN